MRVRTHCDSVAAEKLTCVRMKPFSIGHDRLCDVCIYNFIVCPCVQKTCDLAYAAALNSHPQMGNCYTCECCLILCNCCVCVWKTCARSLLICLLYRHSTMLHDYVRIVIKTRAQHGFAAAENQCICFGSLIANLFHSGNHHVYIML